MSDHISLTHSIQKKMPRKRIPILEKATNLLKVSYFMAKMKKPIGLKLILLKKQTRDFKKLMIKHHNYSYVSEYEFSPSNTPLFHYHRNKSAFKKRSQREVICSLFFLCRPSSNSLRIEGGEREMEEEDYPSEGAKQIMFDNEDNDNEFITTEVVKEPWSNVGEDDSIDQKAEMFIQRFYEEMRIERQESALQFKEMLNRGCS